MQGWENLRGGKVCALPMNPIWFHHLKLEVVYERNNFRVPREFTKVQNVAIAIPESQKLSEPYSLGRNADRQPALSPSAPRQPLLSAGAARKPWMPLLCKRNCVCELHMSCVCQHERVMEDVWHRGCSLHYVWRRVSVQSAHVSAAQIRPKRGNTA